MWFNRTDEHAGYEVSGLGCQNMKQITGPDPAPVQDAPRRRQTIVCRSLCHFFFSAFFFSTAVLFSERRLISVRRWLALESRSRP